MSAASTSPDQLPALGAGLSDASPPDVSVVVVSYDSALLAEALVASIAAQELTIGGRPATVEVVIVDNASRRDEAERLERLAAHAEVRLLRNGENVGYALANQQGLHVSRGALHVVSNPDVELRAGCLQSLADALDQLTGAAVVGPVATMDPEGCVLMPPNELPDPYVESLSALARRYPGIARYNLRRRARFAHRCWTAPGPIRLPMLSGGFFMGRRETFLEHGLFDPGYPLYYEDTDLFRRYHEAGLALWQVPAARILHHFSRSAMTRMKAALYRNRVSARRYFRRWFGPAGERCWKQVNDRADEAGRETLDPQPVTALRAGQAAPTLDLPPGGGYVEVAGNPQFTLAVGILPQGAGTGWTLPQGFWEQLGPSAYWVRCADSETHETLKAWRIDKCPPQ